MAKKKEEPKKEPIKKEEPKTTPASSDDKFATLEKKFEALEKTQAGTKEFIEGANVVIRTLASDPQLTQQFQERLRQQYQQPAQPPAQPPTAPPVQPPTQPPASQPQPTQPTPDQRIAGVEASQREKIVKDFEKEYGMDGQKEEDRKETRKKIANYLSDFGWTVNSVPLQNLAKTLDRAYVGTHAEKLREEGKLEGLTEARAAASGTMPTLGGGTPASAPTTGLTPAQKEWTKKLGVDEAKATKAYLEQDKEETRVPPAEKKKV